MALTSLFSSLHPRAVVQGDGTLTLGDLERKDGGRYTCTATNAHGRDTATYHLTVLGKRVPGIDWRSVYLVNGIHG